MKKKCTFFALATMLSMSNFTFAQEAYMYEDYKTLDVYKTTEDITIDGYANEAIWSDPNVVEMLLDRRQGTEPETGYEAKFKMIYDDVYFYFFFTVKDPTPVLCDATHLGGNIVDNIELYFSTRPNRVLVDNNNITAMTSPDSQLRISVGSETNYASGVGYANGLITNARLSGFEYKTVRTADGYNIEVMLANDAVIPDAYASIFAEGGKMFFDVSGGDFSDFSVKQLATMWSGEDIFAWRRNAMYGEITLMGAPSGIKSITASNVKYAFNNGILSLSNVEGAPQVNIYDLFGRSVKSLTYSGNDIDLTSAASGVYVVNVAGAGNFKIIK